ncbi:MAG: hypothetical protein ACREEM_04815 [Blastocatellia bacterium]
MTRHPRIINSTSGSAMLPNQKRRMKQVIATIRRTTLLLALIFLLIAPLTAIAAQPTPTQTPSVKDVQAKTGGKKDPNGKEKEQPKPPPPVPTKVTCVYNRDFGPDCEKREDQDRNSAGINDTIIVEVKELRQLVTRADCKDPNRPSTCAKQDIILFIDRRPVKGLTPESKWLHPDPDPNPDGILRYHL